MMKNFLLFSLICFSYSVSSQSFISLATDGQGDDHYIDAKELSYRINSTQDTLLVKIEHFNTRSGDFGYALALDTNLNTGDGFLMVQNNLKNQTPNTSMHYDIALYAYQNGFFPGVYTEAYGSDGMATTLPFTFDTTDAHFAIFGIPLSSIGGNVEVNIVAYTGSFDINPSGAGPGDAMPDATFAQLRTSGIGLSEFSKSDFGIYPNPSSDYVHFTKAAGIVHLINASGASLKIIDSDLESGFSVNDLKSGIYFLREIETGKSLKILVQ